MLDQRWLQIAIAEKSHLLHRASENAAAPSCRRWARYGAAILVGWLFFATAHARVIVEISEDYVAIEHEASRMISRQKPYTAGLPRIVNNDSYSVFIGRVSTPLNVEVRDEAAAPGNRALVRFAGSSRGGTLEMLPGLPGNAILMVSPEQEGTSLLRLRVLRHGTRSHESLVATIRFLRESIDRIEAAYRVPTITLRVRPCGVVNAFSSPDITLCTELMDTMFREGWHDAIRVVLYHELAHSLLRLWDLPGYDNEDLADEFAVLHAGDSPRAIEQISRWFESRIPLQKAATQVQMAGGHAPSALRAKRARAGLTNQAQLRVKLDALLAPYRRTR